MKGNVSALAEKKVICCSVSVTRSFGERRGFQKVST
jgi:hypothetical protein